MVDQLLAAIAWPRGDALARNAIVESFGAQLRAGAGRLLSRPSGFGSTALRNGIHHWLSQHESKSTANLVDNPALACWLAQAVWPAGPIAPLPCYPIDSGLGRTLPVMPRMRRFDGALVNPLLGRPKSVGDFGELTDDEVAQELRRAAVVLERDWPEAAEDVDCFVRGIVASRAAPGHQSSGSANLCPFVVSVTIETGARPLLLADALVHEAAHIKLRCVMRFTRFIEDDGTPRFRHPWRSDLRPLEALFVACHAFVAIHRLYVLHAARDPSDDWAATYGARLTSEVASAIDTLDGADGFTRAGRDLVEILVDEFNRSVRLFARRDQHTQSLV